MIVQEASGNYIKLAETSDLSALRDTFQDWRVSALNREILIDAFRNSVNLDIVATLSKITPITKNIILVYCLADSTVVGAFVCNFSGKHETIINMIAIAIHPDHRGGGHFSAFARMLGWFFNKHLKMEQALFEVFTDVTQAKNITTQLGSTFGKRRAANDLSSSKAPGAMNRKTVSEKLDTLLIGYSYSSPIPEVSLEDRYRATGTSNITTLDLTWTLTGPPVVTQKTSLWGRV